MLHLLGAGRRTGVGGGRAVPTLPSRRAFLPYLASSGVSVKRSSTPGRAMSCCTFLVPAVDRELNGGEGKGAKGRITRGGGKGNVLRVPTCQLVCHRRAFGRIGCLDQLPALPFGL